MGDTAKAPFHIQMIVVPSFNLWATMGFIDPFRAANYLDGTAHFRWDFLSEQGGTCLASNGAPLETKALDAGWASPDLVVISSSWTPERHATGRLTNALRQAARAGATLGALDTGAFILAQAGLLKARRATVHYEHIDAFGELYPDVDLSEDLFVFDGTRISCCGGGASVDFGLHVLQGICGSTLANAAARYIFHANLRETGTRQQPEGSEPLGNLVPSSVKAAIRTMEENLEDPIAIPDICAKVGISHRQLDRLFATYIKKTPALYYRDIRLDRARGLVTQTELPMSEIAVASGFSSQVHFSRAYRDRFGLSPRQDRVEGRVPFEFRAWPMHRKRPGG